MKHLIIILLLSTLLLSQERQIILGCYLVEDNAHRAIKSLEKLLLEDKQLKKLVKRDSLKVELKKVEGYNVVTLAPFETYGQLFLGIYYLKIYYDDAYVLDYPFSKKIIKDSFIAPKIELKEDIEVVEENVSEPFIPKLEVDKNISETIKKTTLYKVGEQPKQDKEVEGEIETLKPTKLDTPTKVEEEFYEDESIDVKPITKDDESTNYYLEYFIGFIILSILFVVVFLFYNRDKEDDSLEVDFKS